MRYRDAEIAFVQWCSRHNAPQLDSERCMYAAWRDYKRSLCEFEQALVVKPKREDNDFPAE